MEEKNFELHDLLGSMNTIATVMLVGQTLDSGFYDNSNNMKDLFSGLCEMIKTYADTMFKKGAEPERNEHVREENMIESLDRYKEKLALKKFREDGHVAPHADTKKEINEL